MAAVHFDTRRGYRRLRFSATVGLLVAGAAVCLAGCGGSGKTTSAASTTLVSQAAPPEAAQQSSSVAGGHTTTKDGGRTATPGATTPAAKSRTHATARHGSTGGDAGTGTVAARTPTHEAAGRPRSSTTTTTTHKSGHPATGPAATTTSTTPSWVNTTGNGQTTTIPATGPSPAYVGPSPLGCLESAGLNRARPGTEPEVWEANSGFSAEDDHVATVFLSGPYPDTTTASDYAQSLKVVEVSASGGRWVASAALTSGLDGAVNQVAACMAAG